MPVPQAPERHSLESTNSSQEIQETMSENLFLEIYDPQALRWVVLCPFTG